MTLLQRITSLAQRDSLSMIGLAVTAVWLLLLLLFWLLAPANDDSRGGLATLLGIMGVVLPVVLIWLAVGLARAISTLQAEAADLRARMSQIRTGGIASPSALAPSSAPSSARPQQPDTALGESGVRMITQTQPARPAQTIPRPTRPADARQQALSFDAPEQVSVTPQTMILALNFPDGPDDVDAITALRAALKDHGNSRVLRAAQDVITLLAGHDVYMDDLPTEPVDIEAWRRFGEGVRGASVAGVGGIHDATALEMTGAYLRGDEIFRDTAHHFMRQFDVTATRLMAELDDEQIVMLADSRSARAFMLLGRVAGVFDQTPD
ncbi:hypothetical protein H4P12_14100 [Paracoccus sp. 11-3]|uniref:Uncharacterized protein n=1 Tax=Paracoccus amoyensis TaxID=2760093 RepID=A0A926JDM0_9RHOB|nr:hypothetical protein [Paracoccus amoyensis]MBC9247809.1 hypothetical protein [Paracoccus amoyensis]